MAQEIETHVGSRVEAAYEGTYDLLRFIASRRFRIPECDVRPLIHDVFVAFMRSAAAIGDDRRWLATATINACRNYWRDRKEASPLPDTLLDVRGLTDDAGARVDVALLLAHLSPRCRDVLRLRYVQGLASAEIASRCDTSSGYIRILVHRCLRAARAALLRKR
jgi:RNA polymerase sigma factor (sigma-70 family)